MRRAIALSLGENITEVCSFESSLTLLSRVFTIILNGNFLKQPCYISRNIHSMFIEPLHSFCIFTQCYGLLFDFKEFIHYSSFPFFADNFFLC